MPLTAERFAQIARDRAHIAAFATDHFQSHMVSVRTLHHGQLIHIQRSRFKRDIFARTRKLISALPVHLNSGKLWRNLLDIANKFQQRFLDLIVCRPRLRGGNHFAFSVVGVCRFAKLHIKYIGLERIGDERNRLRRLPQRHGQNACRLGVKRASMARLGRTKRPAHLVHHSG